MQANEFEKYLKLHVNSPKTRKEYLGRVNHFFKRYDEFNQENIDNYLTGLIDEGKKSAFNLSMCSFTKYAKFKKVFIEFPKYKKVARKNVSSLTWEEIEKEILPYFNDIFIDGENRKTVFRFMVLSMLRISEVVNLKKEDLDFETGRIYALGKGNKSRICYINEVIVDDLKKIVEKTKGERAFDFTENYIIYMFSKINNDLQYKKKVTPHTTRRAGARYLVDKGLSILEVQKMLGHESLETTQLYINYTEEETHKHYHQIKYKKG